MINAFFYGILSAFGATIFQQAVILILGIKIIDTSSLTPLLIFGATSEEIFKLIFIYKLRTQTQSLKGMLLGSILIGFGFSLVELTFKLWDNLNNFSEDHLGIIFIHTLTAGVMGIFLAQKWSLTTRIFLGTSLAIILHLAYNALKIYIF